MLILIIFILIAITIFMLYSFLPAYINKKRFFNKEKPKEKVIYLTFDDGPSKYTEKLLEVLKKYNVKATFFCVANFAKERKEIIEKMKHEGHLIALHSLKHKNSMLQTISETKKDLEQGLKIMKELGINIKYYRPPWGDANLYLLKKLKKENIKLILWNVMAEDWEGNTTEKIIANKLITRAKKGDIICLHDGRGKKEAPLRTIKALEIAIPIFLKKGYIFKTIDEYET